MAHYTDHSWINDAGAIVAVTTAPEGAECPHPPGRCRECWSMTYTDDFSRSDEGFGDAKWVDSMSRREWVVGIQRGGLPTDEYSMVEVWCAHCKGRVGQVGLPMRAGAAMIEASFRCADCGETTWWRSAN